MRLRRLGQLNQHTIAAGGIENIRQRVLQGDFSRGNGRMIKEDVLPAYTEEIFHDIAIAVPLKIVIDAGNGATSDLAPKIFELPVCSSSFRSGGSYPSRRQAKDNALISSSKVSVGRRS